MTAGKRAKLAEELKSKCAALGVDESFLGKRGKEPEKFRVWPECWPTLAFFLGRLQTEWDYGPMGGRLRLNKQGVDVVIRRAGYRGKAGDELFEMVQAMEQEILTVERELAEAAG